MRKKMALIKYWLGVATSKDIYIAPDGLKETDDKLYKNMCEDDP